MEYADEQLKGAKMKRIKNNVLNCPNCGAPITGMKCEYCGTMFYDLVNIDADGRTFIRMRLNGQIVTFKAVVTNIEAQTEYQSCLLYEDNRLVYRGNPDYTVTIKMIVLPDENGSLMEVRNAERNEE